MDSDENKDSAVRYPATERILGVYPQRQQGLFMQRVKIFGGRISSNQWRKVVDIVRLYSARSTFHITTRQDIELHDIQPANLMTVQDMLAQAGLSTYGACGDTIRNITVCPGCNSDFDAQRVFVLARFVSDYLSAGSFHLPRKFKISFSGCLSACAKPWFSDLGFVLQKNALFTVIGAGSLGPKPATGISLYNDLDAVNILPLCIAALKFFEEAGDRQDRSKARFRHVRQKLGDTPFRARMLP